MSTENSITIQEGITTVSPIEQALVKANLTEAVLAELATFKELKINGIDDKEGFKKVYAARQRCKNTRVAAVKICEKGREAANAEAARWITKQKEVVGKISDVEDYLQEQETAIEKEKQRLKDEADRKEQARIHERVARLLSLGMAFNGTSYSLHDKTVTTAITSVQVRDFQDNEFNSFVDSVHELAESIKAEEAELERLKEVESERLRIEAVKQAEERKKFEEEQRKFHEEKAKQEAELQAERERIHKEKNDFIAKRKSSRTRQLIDLGLNFNGDSFILQEKDLIYINFHHTDVLAFEDDRWDKEYTKAELAVAEYREFKEKHRQQEIKEAEKKAVERARLEEQERLKKEDEARIERERIEAEEEEQRIASLSDKEKLKALKTQIDAFLASLTPYDLKSKTGRITQLKVIGMITEASNLLK